MLPRVGVGGLQASTATYFVRSVNCAFRGHSGKSRYANGGRSARADEGIEGVRQAKLVRSSRWKSGPSKEERPLGSEGCVATGDSGCEAYTAIAWGVGLSHERSDIVGAESFHSLEGNICGTAMRGADALPGSKATSRAKGLYRNLGDLMSGRRRHLLCEYGGPHREGEEP